MRVLGSLMIWLLTSSMAWPQAAREPSIVERFLAREEAAVTSYVATRRLEASNDRFKVSGWMNVHVELSPERGFEWTIEDQGGSSYVRNRVLGKALEREREAIAHGEAARSALTLANYDLEPLVGSRAVETLTPSGMSRLQLKPKRREVLLVEGTVAVTEPEADLLEVQGRLAKNPSRWTKSVDVIRRYARIAGFRVPIETESTAAVLIAGRSHFKMRNRYLSINGTPITNPTRHEP